MKPDPLFLERLRGSISIVELVGSYVQLRKQGRNYIGLCPFHNEKTPSFSVSEARQHYKCFGCGAGGDAFSFVQQMEGLAFPDAIRFLAERCGIPLPAESAGARGERSKDARFHEMMELAEEFFRSQLAAAPQAADYLKQRRIDAATIDKFGLGFAPPGGRLMARLRREGFLPAEMEACGLAASDESGGYYDKFRNRLIFPIRNLSGRTIAFGGRILGEGRPKYLNSPETPIYHKGHHLFGLHAARETIRQKGFAILVEGYFDCIVPHQFGFQNVVASLGTSLTDEQAALLSRYSRQVVVNYDPDSAGVTAAIRSIDLFLEKGFRVNVVRLPPGQDPDTFLLENGPEAYAGLLRSSEPYLEYLLNQFIARHRDPRSPRGKQELVDQVIPYLLKIPNRIERAEQMARTASRLQVDEALLVQEARRRTRLKDRTTKAPEKAPAPMATPAECLLLAAALDSVLGAEAVSALSEELLDGLVSEPIFRWVLSRANQTREISVMALRASLESAEVDLFDRMCFAADGQVLSAETVRSSLDALRIRLLERRSSLVQSEIARLDREGSSSPARLAELLREKEAIRREREALAAGNGAGGRPVM